MKKKIGIATITCDKDGNIVDAGFKPDMELKSSDKLVSALAGMGAVETEKAELVFAAWMNEVNDIDMADRNEKKVVVENIGTKAVPDSDRKVTSFLFTFEDI